MAEKKQAESKTRAPEKKKGSGLKIALIALILVVIIIGIVFFVLPSMNQPKIATLVINSGSVEVDAGQGFKTAVSGMQLSQGNKVRTLAGSQATIVFLESSTLKLDESTEVTLSGIQSDGKQAGISVQQSSGQSWTQVLQLSGINSFEIETPTVVASVRGTSFGVLVDELQEVSILVGRGQVNVDSFTKEAGKRKIISSLLLSKDEAVNAKKDALSDLKKISSADLQALKPKLKQWLENNKASDESFIQEQKQRVLQNISAYLSVIKSQGNVTDEQIDEALTSYLKGEVKIEASQTEKYGYAPDEVKAMVNDFLSGRMDPVTVASKAQQLSSILQK